MTPAPLQGVLRLYQTKPIALPYFETNAHHSNKLVFVPGLTDTIGVVPYLPRLASVIDEVGFSLVQFVKCSDLGGFGTSSLEGDAQEMAQLLEHLITRSDSPCTGKLVVMGHSTGCQDVVAFLSRERRFLSGRDGPIRVHGGICQAPVSDREYFDAHDGQNPLGQLQLAESRAYIAEGKPGTLLERSSIAQTPRYTDNGRGDGNSASALQPAMTAYRFTSLNARGGDDDLFSTDLRQDELQRTLGPALERAPLLMLFGANECVFQCPCLY